jgi:hypothetical protein
MQLVRRLFLRARAHTHTRTSSLLLESNAVTTLQLQVSGYGTKEVVVQRTLDRMELKEPIP